jgi:hypothetical protein
MNAIEQVPLPRPPGTPFLTEGGEKCLPCTTGVPFRSTP